MKARRLEGKRNDDPRYYFNNFNGAGDYFRGIKFMQRDIENIQEQNKLNQVTLIIFFVLGHRTLNRVDTILNRVLREIHFIDIRGFEDEFNNKLDRNKQSIMITYLQQAIKELMVWDDLSDRDWDELMDFLKDVAERIL